MRHRVIFLMSKKSFEAKEENVGTEIINWDTNWTKLRKTHYWIFLARMLKILLCLFRAKSVNKSDKIQTDTQDQGFFTFNS